VVLLPGSTDVERLRQTLKACPYVNPESLKPGAMEGDVFPEQPVVDVDLPQNDPKRRALRDLLLASFEENDPQRALISAPEP
jgi:hypothetical protein